jgi:lipoprotein-anchoring transpeptidase ErfK/SrfK
MPKKSRLHRHYLPSRLESTIHLAIVGVIFLLTSCATPDRDHRVVISASEQKLALLEKGRLVAVYPVSTSKFGLGDACGSCRTPVGELEVADKIGTGATSGTVFKDRRPIGEVVAVDSPGRDPIVTRILWLRGREPQNANAYARTIYIHGTPEERNIGRPVSYGCVRMRSHDIITLYDFVGKGAQVSIVNEPLSAVASIIHVASPVAQAVPGNGGTSSVSSH